MASTIITKNSSTASATPAVGDLQQGELAVNVTDKKIYTKDSSAAVVKLVGSLGNQEASAVAITGGSIAGITDLAVADGGTGSSTAAGARSNLGAAASGANSDITSLSGLTTALSVAQGGTGVTSSTGTGSVVLSNSPTLVTPALGTPASGVATNLTGLPISTGVSGLGTGVATFLGTPSSANLASAVSDETGSGALVFANSPTLVTPTLGTPASATLTNATGLPISTGVSGLGTGVATFLATPSSANLRSALTDETGTGSAVFATSPALVTPDLGTPSAATLTNATGLPISTGVSGLGTGVATALAVNVGSAGAPVVNGGALGTPSSGTVTNLTGTASININGTVGATTAAAGSFTTLTTSSTVTLNGGTANGLAFLNASKVLTSGSALTFDGTNLGIGTSSPAYKLDLVGGHSRISGAYAQFWFNSDNTNFVGIYNSGSSGAATGQMAFETNGSEGMRLTSTSLYTASGINVGIGTSSPAAKLDVAGSAFIGNATTTGASRLTLDGVGTVGNVPAIRFRSAGVTKAYLGLSGAYLGDTSTDALIATDFAGGAIKFATGDAGITKMTLDSAGNLGLGVTPSAWDSIIKVLELNNGVSYGAQTDSEPVLYLGVNNYYGAGADRYKVSSKAATRYRSNAGEHSWFTAPSGTAGNAISFTQAMTLDASGNLQVGTTSEPFSRGYTKYIAVSSSGSTALEINGASGSTAYLDLGAGGTRGLSFESDGTNNSISAVGAKAIAFNTNSTERARIDSSGNLLVGTTSQQSSAKVTANSETNTSSVFAAWNSTTAGDAQFIWFGTEAGGTTRGSITYNRTAGLTAYNTTSDYRAKDISGPVTGSGALIDSIPVYMGTMKGATQERPMFIAHEVPAYAHTGEKDAVDADGNPVYQQMDASALIPVMWAEIQSLRQRVAQLETN